MERVLKNGPPQIGGHPRIAGAKIETLQGLAAKDQHDREQNKENGSAQSDARGRAFAEGKCAEPKRAAGDEKKHSGPGEIEDNADDDHREGDEPKNPPFASMTDVFLSASEDDDRGQAKEIRG